jgi:hypothetical protein
MLRPVLGMLFFEQTLSILLNTMKILIENEVKWNNNIVQNGKRFTPYLGDNLKVTDLQGLASGFRANSPL